MTAHHFIKKTACWSIVFLCLLTIGGATLTFGYPSAGTTDNGQAEAAGSDVIANIMAVLETKSTDRKILSKASEKLHKLSVRELQLMSLLCDRISTHHDTAGADIAFSLITAMIVLT